VSNRLSGKVAFITGAARGQGRAHAVKMAAEGADIIAVDIAGKLPDCVPYLPATPEDLDETARLVRAAGRRVVSAVVDVRDLDGLKDAVAEGVAQFGRLDVIVANAGVSAPAAWDAITPEDFRDVIDINVTGVWNTVMAGAPSIIAGGRGGSIILISSAAGIKMQPFRFTTPPVSTPWREWPGRSQPNSASTRSGSTASTRVRSTPTWAPVTWSAP